MSTDETPQSLPKPVMRPMSIDSILDNGINTNTNTNTNYLNVNSMANNLTANASATPFAGISDNQSVKIPSRTPSIVAQDSGLANSPRELLDFIASLLPTTDFNNLRLACKLVENKLFPYWSNAFFKKKQFMMTAFSLQTLIDISRHDTIGPCITHLIIGLDHFKIISRFLITTLGEYEQCQDASDLQESLLDSGAALQLLTTAFRNLRNLTNIDVRDFNSNTRFRDHVHDKSVPQPQKVTAWKSYGHSKLGPWSRHLNSQRCELIGEGSHEFVNRVFKVLLAALGQSASPIRGLEVIFRNPNREMALTSGAFAFTPVLDDTVSKLPIVLAGLSKLHLDLSLEYCSLHRVGPFNYLDEESVNMPTSVREICDPLTRSLRNFLTLTPNITWLRLNSVKQTQRLESGLLSWLALDPEQPFGLDVDLRWHKIQPKPVSPPLRRLDIGNTDLKPETLVRILKKFGELEWLSLRSVCMEYANAHYNGPPEGKNHGTVWSSFFRNLPSFASNLRHLLLKNLGQVFKGSDLVLDMIIFAPTVTGGMVNYSETLEFSVGNKTALEALADRTWSQEAWLEVHQAGPYAISDDMSTSSGNGDLIDDEDLDGDVEGFEQHGFGD